MNLTLGHIFLLRYFKYNVLWRGIFGMLEIFNEKNSTKGAFLKWLENFVSILKNHSFEYTPCSALTIYAFILLFHLLIRNNLNLITFNLF